jgi:hypothetical protein
MFEATKRVIRSREDRQEQWATEKEHKDKQ